MPEPSRDSQDLTVVIRTALETLVFAPIGLGVTLMDEASEAVRRVRQELSNARFVGRLTVEQGAARLRAAENDTSGSTSVGAVVAGVAAVDQELAIAGYDEMPAIEIVGLLSALSTAQRSAVADYEYEHRRRRTILGKIAQLDE